MSEIKSANNLCSFFLQLVLIRIYLANIQFISVIFHPLNYNKTENPSKDALQKAETLKKLQITQNDQTDLGDQTDQNDQTDRTDQTHQTDQTDQTEQKNLPTR